MKWILICSAAAMASSAAAFDFELNPYGGFHLSKETPGHTRADISNVGARALDAPFLGSLTNALQEGVNGISSSLTPVAVDLTATATLDYMLANVDDTTYTTMNGGGWQHGVRYNAPGGMSDWRSIFYVEADYGNYQMKMIREDDYTNDFLTANYPFQHAIEDRDGTSAFGPYNIADGTNTGWYYAKGKFIHLDVYYLLGRVNGNNLELGGAWGFHEESSTVPEPASLLVLGVGVLGAFRLRRR